MSAARRVLRVDVNLAATPFRSFKVYWAIWGTLAAIAVGTLLWEVWSIGSLLMRRQEATARMAELELRMERDLAIIRKLEPYLDAKRLQKAEAEVMEVRQLVERRTFDWTQLLSELELVLPNGVRVVELAPVASKDGVAIDMQGVARGLADQNDLVERLEKSELFDNVFVVNQVMSGSEVEFGLRCIYRGAGKPKLGRPGRPS